MPTPFDPAFKVIQKKMKSFLGFFLFLAALSVGAGEAVAQWPNIDPVLEEDIGLGTAALLLAWWILLAWRQKNRLMLELQDYLIENKMVSFNLVRVKGSAPWNVSERFWRLLRSLGAEFKAMNEKVRETNQTLEKYIGNKVTEKAVQQAGRSELGGELRRVYVLFSDVRGFTRMTEKLKPEETLEILNKMFTAMEEVITQNGGDINKYIGDAILAYFRRPYGSEGEAAKLVLRCALRMQDRFEILNQSFKVAYSKPVEIGLGIGITAGEAIMGNLGSANRMEYTLIGDTVNLSSRLCGIAKHGQILLNEEMAQAAKDHFQMTALPPVQIKGKEGLITPYAVMGESLGLQR